MEGSWQPHRPAPNDQPHQQSQNQQQTAAAAPGLPPERVGRMAPGEAAAPPRASPSPVGSDAAELVLPAPPPPPPPEVVVDRPPGMPQAVETSTTAISLQWAAVACTVQSQVAVAVEYIINYKLEMQQVDDMLGLLPNRWSTQYVGTASFVQVKGLRPGRSYAARVTAEPYVTNLPDCVVKASQPSETVLVHTVPCPPMGQPAPQLASRAKKELKLKWSEPEETGGRALEYVFEMTPAPEGWEGPPTADGFSAIYRGPERSYMAKRLVPGVQYCTRVKAVNCEGESAWSPLGVFYTQATVPSWEPCDAPFVFDTSASSVTLGWPEPANNGGAVTDYEVEMDDGSGFRHVARTAERTCTVHGLRSGIQYKFRVRAENEAGRSLWSPLGEGRTAAVAPGPCGAPSLLGSNQNSLTVRWDAPEDDGGMPISCYQVELRPSCPAACRYLTTDDWLIAYKGPNQACTIEGLRAGCSYMARVCALNQAGTGAFSSVTILHTAPSTPEVPGAPAAVARQQAELTVSWAAPEHDGGSRITSYRLEMKCQGGSDGGRGEAAAKGKAKVDPPYELAYLGPERTTVVGGLEPGHRYAFRCSAINAQGSSGWGPVAQADTLPGLPLPVDSLHIASITATSIKLQWNQPFGQGAPVSSYVLEMAALPAGGEAEAEHLLQEAAAEEQQAGQQQAEQQQQEPAGDEQHAAASQDARVAAGQQANGLAAAHGPRSSTAVAEPAFRPAYQGSACCCTVSGLEPHAAYLFRVRAINAVGSSLGQAESCRTAPAAPSCPVALRQADATPSTLSLTWLPPAREQGAPVSGYQLECARAARTGSLAAGAWRLAYQGADLHAQADGLEAGSRYLVRARAANACGWGPWSDPLACSTAPDVPAAPRSLAAKAVGTTVRANWEAADDSGSPVTAYELEVAPAGNARFEAAFRGDALTHRLQQLEPSSAYQLRVRAINAVGAGPYCQVLSVRTSKAPPSPPTDVEVQVMADSSSVEVSWEVAQQGAAQAACISWEAEAAGPNTVRQTCAGRSTQMVLMGLQPGAAYSVRVRGVGADGAGHGAWSAVAQIKLPQRRPEEVSTEAAAGLGAAAAGTLESASSSRAQKRKGERGAGGQPRTAAAMVKTAAAKAPRRKGIMAAISRFLRHRFGTSLEAVLAFLVGVVLVALCILLFK